MTWSSNKSIGNHRLRILPTNSLVIEVYRIEKVLNFLNLVYHCRDCALTPTSYLCKICWGSSNHKNHRFNTTSIKYGTCCCGLAVRWKK